MRIDAHQHFWNYTPAKYDWIDESMSAIARSFAPADLQAHLKSQRFDGCVAVQARQTEEETNMLVELSKQYDMIKAVVGWVDLKSENVRQRLDHFSQEKIIKGFRHVLQGEPDLDFMLQPAFTNGIAALQEYGFVYDILIFPRQLPNAYKLVKLSPGQTFVLDHIAKPDIKSGKQADWKTDIKKLSALPNVYCKISGMVTEGDWKNTSPDIFKMYIDHVVNCFGAERVMFGSDWPVCLVAASYDQVVKILEENTSDFTPTEKELLWGENCRKVYNRI